MTGASRESSLDASRHERAPVATTIAAAGTAKIASGQPNGRTTAHANTMNNNATDIDSATAALKQEPSCVVVVGVPGRLTETLDAQR